MLTNGAIIYYKSFVARKVTGENYATTDAWLLLYSKNIIGSGQTGE